MVFSYRTRYSRGRSFSSSLKRRFIPLSCLDILEKTLSLIPDPDLDSFFTAASRKGGIVPFESLRRAIDHVNSLYWDYLGKGNLERESLYRLHKELKKDFVFSSQKRPLHPRGEVKTSPLYKNKSNPKPRLSLDEIRRRQLERRNQIKSHLLRLGNREPGLRRHLIPILDVI